MCNSMQDMVAEAAACGAGEAPAPCPKVEQPEEASAPNPVDDACPEDFPCPYPGELSRLHGLCLRVSALLPCLQTLFISVLPACAAASLAGPALTRWAKRHMNWQHRQRH